jgi:hypothetical protein
VPLTAIKPAWGFRHRTSRQQNYIQDLFLAGRRGAKDGPVIARAAAIRGGAVEYTVHVDQAGLGISGVVAAGPETVHHVLRLGGTEAHDRSVAVRTTVIRGAVELAVHVDQGRLGIRAIGAATEAVQHFFRAARRDTEDGSLAVRAAFISSAVERAVHVDQASLGIFAVGAAAEAMQYFFRTGRRGGEDRSVA